MAELDVDVLEVFEPFLGKESRYKAAYGGRGGAKSHYFAEAIILRCFSQTTRVACIREVQSTIKDSVLQLLLDKIRKFGMQKSFVFKNNEIHGPRGSLIVFKGMQSYNADNIKSLEGFDIAWVEEAQNLSERSLRLLRPTIRKEGSELWFSWNPRHDTDPVDKFFRQTPPHNAIIIPCSWKDNKFLTGPLLEEKDHDYMVDPEMAEHVWGGGYEIISEASYYARLVMAAEKDGRVGNFPHDPTKPVITGWDLGIDDYTAIWFAQIINPFRLRIIDYYECQNFGIDEILRDALPEVVAPEIMTSSEKEASMIDMGREDPFLYRQHYFPHDIGMREWGAGGRTRAESAMALGVKAATINRGVAVNPSERIQASRKLLPVCEFHQSKRVMQGLTRLRRYSRKRNELMGTYTGVLKDGNDHGADAFGELAINAPILYKTDKPKEKPKPQPGQVHIAPPDMEPRRQKRTEI